jgi:signal transduction histidine kinase
MLEKLDLLEMILTYDQDGRLVSGNRRALCELGYSEKNIRGRPLIELLVGEEEIVEELQDLGEPSEWSGLNIYRKNKTCFPVFLRAEPAEKDDELNYLLALNLTVQMHLEKENTVLKQETEELRKSRNEFVANMTHELRTPVNGIRGHVSALLQSSTNASDRKTYSIIHKCCEDMSFIIDNILDYSKLEAGKFELTCEVFDLYELLNHIVTANLAVVNEKGIRIILNIADNVPREVYGDGVRIRQILNNLVSNAIKFTDIGHVSIDVNRHGQQGDTLDLFFLVRDTGIGISPENMDRLFKSFSQIDGSSTRKYGGTGLGLMIAKDLVELMEGKIRAESILGKGSSFSFNIHLKTADYEAFLSADKEQPVAEPQEEQAPQTATPATTDGFFLYESILQNLTLELVERDPVFQFGTAENLREVRKKCDIIVLSFDLDAWDKAEAAFESLKKLLNDSSEELKKIIFRLGMAVRKGEAEKSRKFFAQLQSQLPQLPQLPQVPQLD